MENLKDAVPMQSFEKIFGDISEKIIAQNVNELRQNKPAQIPPICMFIWDEMVHRQQVSQKQKFAIAPIINRGYDGIYDFVRKKLKGAPIRDAFSAEYFNAFNERAFAKISLALCYPNDLHIMDVEFSDNRTPILSDDPTFQYRDFKGLHVFGEFIERLKAIGQANGVERISLMVAYKPLHQVFLRHGFVVSDTEMAKMALANAGHGFPMIFPVK